MEAGTRKSDYAVKRVVDLPFDEALERTRIALKDAGFGVLTEIDMKAKLKEKLDREFRSYVILGACNPGFAFEALQEDLDIGLLLPCNVVIYDDEAGTVVSAIDPEKAMSIAEVPSMEMIARNVGERLRFALESI